jgi:hypothetical protein
MKHCYSICRHGCNVDGYILVKGDGGGVLGRGGAMVILIKQSKLIGAIFKPELRNVCERGWFVGILKVVRLGVLQEIDR